MDTPKKSGETDFICVVGNITKFKFNKAVVIIGKMKLQA